MLVGFLFIMTVLTVLLALPFLLAYLTTLENKPKNHWFYLSKQLMDSYGRTKSSFYIIPAPVAFSVLSGLSTSFELEIYIQVLIAIGTVAWFLIASWEFLFSGKHFLENPLVISLAIILLIIACWVFPEEKWFFSIYGFTIASLWGLNIFKYRAIKKYANA
jgi:hypothetical protein